MMKLKTKHFTRTLSLFNTMPVLPCLGAIRGSSRENFTATGFLAKPFLVRACATYKPVNFINGLFLCCKALFSIKEVCTLSLVPSFIALLLKECLGLLQDLLFNLCGSFFDFQSFAFYRGIGHVSVFFLYCQHL